MSITPSVLPSPPERLLHPDERDRRRIHRLGQVASDLRRGTTTIQDLRTRLAHGIDIPVTANLVRQSADPISHANVSAARALGFIVPGP
ncbi:MAG TPA: hypothetical protein VM327_10220 [Candidatus Thermoplasmatota archaeon]|nr:hypothetical protein [Candidatus Thermoplasmatota archaeon]